MTDGLDLKASYFDNSALNASAGGKSLYYRREGINKINASLEDALKIGALKYNETQLDVTAQVTIANPENFYAFSLDGDSLKLGLTNITASSGLRAQLMDSSGKVLADSSSFASESLKEAFGKLNSSEGLDLEKGDYYVKVSFDLAQLKSRPQAYQLSLYSGTKFSSSYETMVKSQTKPSQHVAVDNTMTFSTLKALQYTNDDVHRANATADTAINIGWLYENKTALGVTSQLTNTCDEHFYNFTIQKGECLKFAMDNRTDTADIRVQIMDPTGTFVYADSHGTEAQKEAYAKLGTSEGLAARTGTYLAKISFAGGEDKSKPQTYNFKVFSGEVFTDFYQSTVTTETSETSLLSGSWSTQYNPINSLVSYMEAAASGNTPDVMEVLSEI